MNQVTDKQAEIKAVPVKREVTKEDVCIKVLEKLGKPPNFHRCTATNIPNSCNYRVNVWDKREYCTGHITDSFFVKVDDDGEIVSPVIKRKYPTHKV